MDDSISSILKKAFIFYFCECLVLWFLMAGYTANYDKLATTIYINGTEINYYGNDSYRNYIFPIRIVNHIDSMHPKTDLELSNKYIIKLTECEVYYESSGLRKNNNLGNNCGEKNDHELKFKIVDESSFTMKIYRKNKLIYDGEFVSDVTDYISEKGRYYFHIYGKRRAGIISNVESHFAFNVVIGGGNYED